MPNIKHILEITALGIVIGAATGGAVIKILGVETEKAHAQDIETMRKERKEMIEDSESRLMEQLFKIQATADDGRKWGWCAVNKITPEVCALQTAPAIIIKK
jgi:hypothetical protein